jgi:hypothetical protein
MTARAFDDTSGKWPAMAASLLVRLSAGLLQWQNPGEASALLLHALGAPISGWAGFFSTRTSRIFRSPAVLARHWAHTGKFGRWF